MTAQQTVKLKRVMKNETEVLKEERRVRARVAKDEAEYNCLLLEQALVEENMLPVVKDIVQKLRKEISELKDNVISLDSEKLLLKTNK